jgi:DNA-binding FadR family transcriptional regulator
MPQDTTRVARRATVSRIAVPKPHDVLADHLRERILSGEISEGQALPSERDLVEQTGLSRGTIRAALRTLAVEGLIETKHGRFGGSIATLPGHDSIASAVHRFVQGRRVSLRSLQETRQILEPHLARLAAERRSETQLSEMMALHAELVAAADDFHRFALLNVEWHNSVARASGNELLATLLYSISHGVQIATIREEYDTRQLRRQIINVHERIMRAIEARDAGLAEGSMRLHMTATHARPLAIDAAEIPLTAETEPARVRQVASAKLGRR